MALTQGKKIIPGEDFVPHTQGAIVIHAILVDGMIERIEGSPEFADAEIGRRRDAGHSSAYLFAARNDKEFERKRKVRPLLSHDSASAR
jgi:hypothetical protein